MKNCDYEAAPKNLTILTNFMLDMTVIMKDVKTAFYNLYV